MENSKKLKKFSEICEASISDASITYLTYKFLTMIKTPFKKWEAYKLGVIDEKGNKIKEPKTKEEKKSFDKLTNLIRKIKRILGKYIPNEKLLTFIIGVYLLKETYDDATYSDLSYKLRNNLTEEETSMLLDILQEHKT